MKVKYNEVKIDRAPGIRSFDLLPETELEADLLHEFFVQRPETNVIKNMNFEILGHSYVSFILRADTH